MKGIAFKEPPRVEKQLRRDDEASCAKCGGLGKERVDEWTYRLCACVMRRVIAQRLGALANAPTIESTPLYDERSGADLTHTNLLLTGDWSLVAAHLRNALSWKIVRLYPQTYRFRVVTDEALRRGYFATSDKFSDEPQEPLHEMVAGHHIVIIRLGFLGYANKAMPGILREALMIRD